MKTLTAVICLAALGCDPAAPPPCTSPKHEWGDWEPVGGEHREGYVLQARRCRNCGYTVEQW